MKSTDKVTMTVGQLKRLIKESKQKKLMENDFENSLSLEDAFKQFVEEKCPSKEIEMYASYDDRLSEKDVMKIMESDHPRDAFYEILDEAYMDSIYLYEDDIKKEFEYWCEKHGYDFIAFDLNDNDIFVSDYISPRR